MNPSLTPLIEELKRCNAAYEMLCDDRKKVPMSERRFKWPAMQREADALCGAIMRLERKIIEGVLEE